ncbi:exopolysaccharide biosynthesis polyprenyl glycosylphosphotransferase [Jannaschia sp. R86511]|uniref:exopolysaccharide biosynthesis polyprenyl glycosylphosphotransferase n=1 Tax=Jannaschia sp. R86511 TaxID=3093853 RepID=UPI0036D3935D
MIASSAGLGLSVHQRVTADRLSVPVVLERAGSASARAIVPVLVARDALAAVVAATTGALLLRAAAGDDTVLSPLVLALLALSVPLWSAMLVLARAYETRYLYAGSGEINRIGIAAAMTGLPVLLGSWLVLPPQLAWVVVLAGGLGLGLTLAGRWVARMRAQRQNREGTVRVRAVTVGERADVDRLATRLRQNTYHGWSVVDEVLLDVHGTRADVTAVVAAARSSQADVVMLAPSGGHHLGSVTDLQRALQAEGIELALTPPMVEAVGPRVTVDSLCGLPVVRVRSPELNGPRRWLKSLADRGGALVALVLLIPVLLLLALLVRLTSRGPALFLQERVGRGGSRFRMVKLRSMYVDAEDRLAELAGRNEAAGPLFKLTDDPRVTPLGRWLRRTSLDELPQLLNVLVGQMSLVGPRPALVSEVMQYDRDTRRRLLVAPGITGLWQVHGRSDLPWEESKRLDLRYVENWSLGFDLSILVRTVDVVLRRKGAY